MKNKIIILTGPTCAGKTTLAHELIKNPSLEFAISATTRSPRPFEIDGLDYEFMNQEKFGRYIVSDYFLEYEEVYPSKYYGTIYSELKKIWDMGKTPIKVIDVNGAKRLKENFPKNILSIFVRAPSLKILKERLIKRNPEDFKDRLKKVKFELSFQKYSDRLVTSRDLEKSTWYTNILIDVFLKNKPELVLKTAQKLF